MLLMIAAMQNLERRHSQPEHALPPGATDCHMHVFGPLERFPLAAERSYNVTDAPLAAHERMKRQVGLERTVLVQASGHGTDNRAMLAALATLGPRVGQGGGRRPHHAPHRRAPRGNTLYPRACGGCSGACRLGFRLAEYRLSRWRPSPRRRAARLS